MQAALSTLFQTVSSEDNCKGLPNFANASKPLLPACTYLRCHLSSWSQQVAAQSEHEWRHWQSDSSEQVMGCQNPE